MPPGLTARAIKSNQAVLNFTARANSARPTRKSTDQPAKRRLASARPVRSNRTVLNLSARVHPSEANSAEQPPTSHLSAAGAVKSTVLNLGARARAGPLLCSLDTLQTALHLKLEAYETPRHPQAPLTAADIHLSVSAGGAHTLPSGPSSRSG